ncbi:DDE endonuclease [Streptomyces sp. NPDC004680]|uniref:DDE endonuclease n=1 Tax=Streptomyces sp. NPDC004680 TaxID=3154287 RepID=UPI0033A18A87
MQASWNQTRACLVAASSAPRMLVRARIQLGGPIVLVWDNVRLHLTARMREWAAANVAHHLPTARIRAPDLNPREGIRSLVKREIGNLAAADLAQITKAIKRRLRRIQYRPHRVDGCLAGTGLAIHEERTQGTAGPARWP